MFEKNNNKISLRLIFKLAKSDLIKTYRGAALGWGWAIIKPTVSILVYWIVFKIGLGFRGSYGNYPALLWLIVGLIPWFFMSEMISQGMGSLRSYSYLITKMKFPVATIPFFVGLSKLFVHLGLMVIVLLMFLSFGFKPDIYYLELAYYIPMMYLFFVLWSLFSSPLAAISKDFANLVISFIPALLWLSGVIWDPSSIHNEYFALFLKLNPVTYLTQGYRDSMINKVWFWEKTETLYFLGILLVMAFIAIWMYNKLRKEVPDVL